MTAQKMSVGWVLILGLVFSMGLCGVAAAQEENEQDTEIAWFDMDHCEVCKNFAPMKESMHRIKWENHLLDDGMISVSVVPDDMKAGMKKAEDGIQNTVAKLSQGQQLDMCGHCHVMGKMMMMGAKFKEIKTLGVDITIVTSSDPEVVKEIHAFAEQSKVEYEKMLEKLAADKE